MRNIFFFCLSLGWASIAAAQSNPGFTIQLEDSGNAIAPKLQSYCLAASGGKILLFGGRINGFHGTSDMESTFPSQYSNRYFWVLDPINQKSWKADLPAGFKYQLSSTNMEFFQDDDVLYCIGGYGSQCDQDSASCYQTFPNLTSIRVTALMNAIISGQTSNLGQYLSSITDERMRVTGGSLKKLGDWFYLCFGHNYYTMYKGGVTGIYTEQIRKFKIQNSGTSLSITNYQTYTDPTNLQPQSEFHRRDLNVVETIMPDGTIGLTAYGGVFTQYGSAWFHPISVYQSASGVTTNKVDTSFNQKFNLYDCASISMYDKVTKNMYTSMLGGITFYYYDKNGNLEPSNGLNFMPFSNNLTTLVRGSNGKTVEYPQQSPALPGYIGSNAVFVPAPNIPMYSTGGSHDIIDLNIIPTGIPVLIGYMYGGIMATADQSSEFNPTFASSKIYNVYLTRN